MAEGHAGSMCLGRYAQQRHLSARPVPPIAQSKGTEETILTAAYHMLKDGTFYADLGAAHFDRRRPETQARRLVKRLADLGFSVQLKPVAALS